MNTVRIISGAYKGRRLTTPGGKTHPMGERERIALFNMIGPFLGGARVLDAFSGSGALGIEALSRGAEEVVFIEKSREAVKVLNKNLEEVGAVSATVYTMKVSDYTSDAQFDVILADPPYDNYNASDILHLAEFIGEFGMLALSHPGEAPEIPGLSLDKTRKYAGATISIYVKG